MSGSRNLQVIATEIVDEKTGKPKIFCEFCCVTFQRKNYLYSHLRKFHDLPVEKGGNQICGLCNKKVRTMGLLHEHLQNEHSVTLKFIDKTFYSQNEFQDWKTEMEKESLSSFAVRNHSSEKESGIVNTYYICHRSGQCRYKQNRIRSIKANGSIKTGSTCPAFIKVSTKTIAGISEIKVQYQSVHVGHDLETRTLRLTKEERSNLASCLKLGMSKDKILEQAKQNSSPTNRYSCLTRRHLHNICRDFRIKLNSPKSKAAKVKKNIFEASDSSISYEDYLEIELSHSEEIQVNEQIQEIEKIPENDKNQENERIQQLEKSTAVSSLLLLHNHNYSEDLPNKKVQIVNQLKELLLRIEKWDPARPLPDVEEYIGAVNAVLDISASSNPKLHLDGTLPVSSEAPSNKPATKRRKVTSGKKVSLKNSVFL